MGKPSQIYTIIRNNEIQVEGKAKISLEFKLY